MRAFGLCLTGSGTVLCEPLSAAMDMLLIPHQAHRFVELVSLFQELPQMVSSKLLLPFALPDKLLWLLCMRCCEMCGGGWHWTQPAIEEQLWWHGARPLAAGRCLQSALHLLCRYAICMRTTFQLSNVAMRPAFWTSTESNCPALCGTPLSA